MAPKYKVIYFDLTALGEPIRWLFKYGGIEFEDCRYAREQWPKSTTPFGQLPLLEVDGKVYNQSLAITRYVAKLVKLAGKTDEEAMQIDAMVDNIYDLRLKIGQYGYENDETIRAKYHKILVDETLPFFLGKLEETAKNNNGHLVLGELTYADIYFSAVLDYYNYLMKINIIEKYPNLQKLNEKVRNLPAIKTWIAKRPNTVF